MKPFILIDPEQPGNYYAAFYLLAFLVGFILLLWEGRKRKLPVVPWMMVVATAFLFFIVGCRLVGFSQTEWSYVLRLEAVPYATGLSVLGGILFSIPGILLAKQSLRFKHEVVDAFAFVLPVALIIERFGCLLAGCCYGTPVALPWSIQYPRGSHAFAEQLRNGMISSESALSLPVHPVQAYEALGCIVVVLMLIRLRKVLLAPGNLFFASIGLYGILRFGLEFVRASAGHAVGGDYAFHLNYVQWSILLLLPILLAYMRRNEARFDLKKKLAPASRSEFVRPACYFFLLMVFSFFVSRWLSPLEILSFNIVLVPMLAILAWFLFSRATVPGYRWASLVLPSLAFVLMSQTLPEYSKDQNSKVSYNTLSGGWLSGYTNLSNSSNTTTGGPTDCNGYGPPYVYTNTTTKSDNTYSTGALGISRTRQLGARESISFGISGFATEHHENFDQSTVTTISNSSSVSRSHYAGDKHYSFYGVSPYFQHDTRGLGIGAGFTVGELGSLVDAPVEGSYMKRISLAPMVHLRVGNLSTLFFEYKWGSQFPPRIPISNHQIAIGSGLGQTNGTVLRVGTASYVNFFVSLGIPVGKNFIIEPYVARGAGLSSPSGSSGFNASLSLHYKFNKK